MGEFAEVRRLDYLSPPKAADPRLAFDHLFPGDRGHMFGVLECRDRRGDTVILRAFSSLHEGVRRVEGWVPPILSSRNYRDTVLPGQAAIKKLSREMEGLDLHSSARSTLFERRKRISQQLMEEIQSLYRFRNFRGEVRSLYDACSIEGAIPGGVGECCAPKLLNHAARRGLLPVGIAEFYWGGPSPSGNRLPGEFYPCCESRCRPLLGFMLCGLDDAA